MIERKMKAFPAIGVTYIGPPTPSVELLKNGFQLISAKPIKYKSL
jgi:hypothetical protein